MKSNVIVSLLALAAISSFQSLNAQSLAEANRFVRNEQYEDAENVFKTLITKKPKVGDNYYYAGINSLLKGDSLGAIDYFDKGLLNAPKSKINLIGKGLISLRSGDQNAAEAFFQQALTEKKKLQPLMNKEIGRAYLMVEYGPKETLIRYANKAKNHLEKGTTDFENKLLLGDALMILNELDLSAAVQQFIVAGYEEPTDPRPLLKEARVYRRVKNYELSKLRINEALEKDREYAPAYRQMAEIMNLMDQRDSAIIYFKEYLKRNNNLTARRLFVEALYLNAQFDEAINEGNALLKQKEMPNIYGVIAYAYVGKKDITKEEVKIALQNFDLYESKYVKPMGRNLMGRELYFKSILLFKDNQQSPAFNGFKTVLNDTMRSSNSMYDATFELYYGLGGDKQREISAITAADTVYNPNQEENEKKIQVLKSESNLAYERAFEILQLKRNKNNGTLNLRDLFFQARTLSFMGQNDKALNVYKEIVKQDSNYLSGYYLIATTEASIDPTDSSGRVTAAYERWISKMDATQKAKSIKDVENAYRNMAFFAQKNKNYPKVSYYYGKVLEIKPTDNSVIEMKKRIDDYLAKVAAREAKMKVKPESANK
jgi:tetratricopeptide (TPR) repeat protein